MAQEIAVGNVPGGSTRLMAKRRFYWRIALAVAGLAVLGMVRFASLNAQNATTLLACLVGLIVVGRVLLPGMDFLKKREAQAIQGARAEEEVASILARFPDSCIILHDIAARYGNIDHLVLREDGAIFLIETKSHRGKITAESGILSRNGLPFEKDFIRQTTTNVFWLRDILREQFQIKAWVNAAIVFPNAFVAVRSTLYGVDVINTNCLEHWIQKARGNPEVATQIALQRDRLRMALGGNEPRWSARPVHELVEG